MNGSHSISSCFDEKGCCDQKKKKKKRFFRKLIGSLLLLPIATYSCTVILCTMKLTMVWFFWFSLRDTDDNGEYISDDTDYTVITLYVLRVCVYDIQLCRILCVRRVAAFLWGILQMLSVFGHHPFLPRWLKRFWINQRDSVAVDCLLLTV